MQMVIKEIELGEIDGEIGVVSMKGVFKKESEVDSNEGIYL